MSDRAVKFKINGGFTRKEIYKMYDEALEVLEVVGAECHHENILSRLSDFKGVKVGKDRVFFKRDLVDGMVKAMQKKRDKEKRAKPDSFGMGGPYTCFNYLDFNSDRPRKATLADLRTAVKLMDMLDIEYGCAPVIPGDVPIELQRLAMLKTSIENSKSIGAVAMGASSIREAELLCEMGEASGRNPPFVSLQFGISPLKFDDKMLDIGYHFLEKGKGNLVSLGGAPMGCAGITAPQFVPGVFVLGIAECIACEVLCALIFREHEEDKFHPNVYAATFDMKYGNYIFGGTPEFLLFFLARAQIAGELFRESNSGTFGTTCSSIDEQTAAERAMNVIIAALNGATYFRWSGMIALDIIFSPEQLVIDREILDWAQRFMGGMELLGKKGLSLETIKEVGIGGNYMTHETTLENYKKFYWQPKLFEHFSYGQWIDKGYPSLRARVSQVAKDKIESHKFEIDPSIRNKMEAVYKKAQEKLV